MIKSTVDCTITWALIRLKIGKSKINSTSNTKNTRAIKKKRKDKGVRGKDLGIKPHSKGLDFSESIRDFLEILMFTIASKSDKLRDKHKRVKSLISHCRG